LGSLVLVNLKILFPCIFGLSATQTTRPLTELSFDFLSHPLMLLGIRSSK
jgi:hypothetical protein